VSVEPGARTASTETTREPFESRVVRSSTFPDS
jgi:hypothetical protein